jgi:hypothetical protein
MAASDDAQRELEQRALRNVRGLVDRIEDDEKLSRRAQMRTVAILVAVVLVVLVGAAALLARHESPGPIQASQPTQSVPKPPRTAQ